VGVEILVRLLSPRKQMIVDLCTRLMSLGLAGLVTWQMTQYANKIQQSGEVSMNLKLPEYMVIYATSFCLLILALVMVQEIASILRRFKEK
jgi:TRAP-type C4-dicarboxylate transport system permease small subunit